MKIVGSSEMNFAPSYDLKTVIKGGEAIYENI